MSLFHFQEWFSILIPNAWTIAVEQLLPNENREQIVVGTLDGLLTVLDPGRSSAENREQMSSLAEISLDRPILQVSTGRFLPSSFGDDQPPLIAVLQPNSLAFFRLTSNPKNSEAFNCEQVFVHKIAGPPSFNMCQGEFGKTNVMQICVQSINGSLCVFNAENQLLTFQSQCLHPGPLEYTTFTDSILFASDGRLAAVRYSMFTQYGKNPSFPGLTPKNLNDKKVAKRMSPEWEVNLGDTVLDIKVVMTTSILVLCKRILMCVNVGDRSYGFRSPQVHVKTQYTQLCIGSSTKTLIFFRDAEMAWTTQLSDVPVIVRLMNLSDSLRSMVVILTSENKIIVGYLGTEPALFRMPVTQSRFIDFEARKAELREFELAIWRNSKDNPANKNGLSTEFQLEVSITEDSQSVAYHAFDGVSSATMKISIIGTLKYSMNLVLQCPEDCNVGQSSFYIPASELGTQSVSTSLFCSSKPIFDQRGQIVADCNSEVVVKEFRIPLKLLCREEHTQRSASFKLTIESSKEVLDLALLFSEFKIAEKSTSLGLRPHFSEATVSIFVASKTNRYRIQSDSPNFCFVIITELISRIKAQQPDVVLYSPPPITPLLTSLADYLEAEKEADVLEREVNRLSVQFRSVETLYLGKMKASSSSDDYELPVHINILVEYTYTELNAALDRLITATNSLKQTKRPTLRALLNITAWAIELKGLNNSKANRKLFFDGRILDATDQKIGERLSYLLMATNPREDLVVQLAQNPVQLCRLLAEVINHLFEFDEKSGDRLRQIAEVPENEDEEFEGDEKRDEREKAQMEQTIDQNITSGYNEFTELESGSLPATNLHRENAD